MAETLLASRLAGHVGTLAGAIGERHVGRPRALRAAEAYVHEGLAALAFDVERQAYDVAGVECANLAVTIRGTRDPETIVLAGAHYDTVPGSPGADDNASGVAAILELANMLRDAPPARTLRLVAFVNEEPPFFPFGPMGSRVYARAARGRGENIVAMLSLEMLGFYADAPGSQRYPPLIGRFYPKRADFIAFVSNLRSRHTLRAAVQAFRQGSDMPAESLAAPAIVPGVSWSDQRSFWKEGFRALMVTDTAFYRNPHYHRASDTPDTLDYARMARVVVGLRACLTALSAVR